MTMRFNDFVDKKERKARKHLGLIKGILEQSGFRIMDQLESRGDPYIFVYSPSKGNLSFEGVRIYEIGGDIAYRIQKEEKTHPFGRAYALPVEDMFEDMVGEEDMTDEKIGKEIMKAVTDNIKKFFEKSEEAERTQPPRQDPLGKVHQRSTGTDYANNVTQSSTGS